MTTIDGSNLYQCQKCFKYEACYTLVPTICRCGGVVEEVAVGESLEVEILKRRSLSKKDYETIFERDKGICWICKLKIDLLHDRWEAAHAIARGMGGSNDLDNYHPAHYACHREETYAVDIPQIAKSKRVIAKNKGFVKSSNPMMGSKKSGFKRGFDGKVTKR